MLMYIHTLYINTIVCMHYIYIHIILYIPCVHVYIYIYIKNMVYTLYADRNTYIVFIYFLSFVFQSLHCAWHTEGIIGYVLRVASWCSKYVGHHPNQTCWGHRGGCQYFPREHGPAWRPSLASWDLQREAQRGGTWDAGVGPPVAVPTGRSQIGMAVNWPLCSHSNRRWPWLCVELK